MATVSVIIPSYRRADRVGNSVLSVLDQTFHDLEVIVIDDGSLDGTDRIVKAIADPRVMYVQHEANRGGNAARNTGIRHASGDFIAFLDSDDVWEPWKLQAQVEQLERVGSEFGFCTTWIVRVDPLGREIARIEPEPEGRSPYRLWEGNDLGGFSTLLVRRAALDCIGELDESLASCQDWDCYLRLSCVTKWTVVREPLVRYVDDQGDIVRITSCRKSVISGTRHVLDRLLESRDEIPPDVVVRSLMNFLVLFAWAGSVSNYVRVCHSVPLRYWNADRRHLAGSNFRYSLRQAVRAERPIVSQADVHGVRSLRSGRMQGGDT